MSLANQQQNERARALLTRRAFTLGGVLGLGAAALGGRLYVLQAARAGEYARLAERNRISVRLTPPRRGVITDRRGVPLASARRSWRVVLTREDAGDLNAALDKIHRLMPISAARRKRILRQARNAAPFAPIVVAEDLPWRIYTRLGVHAPDLPGVSLIEGAARTYPYGEVGAHVVGYVSPPTARDLEKRGRDRDPLLRAPGVRFGRRGVERAFEESLRGKPGTLRLEVNAQGRVVRRLASDAGEQGEALRLSLDADLAVYAHDRLRGESGAVCVMDARKGDVLALASTPSFDPNAFHFGIGSKAWKDILNNPRKPLVHKAAGGLYPPGSTFKMITLLAALEAKVMQPWEGIECEGRMTYGDRDYHCWEPKGHGRVAMRDSLTKSCDIYLYEAARRVGVERLGKMARRFGLGEPFALPIPDLKSGVVPDKAWKRRRFDAPWAAGETLIFGIGQGYVLTTPIELAVMTARLATGRAVRPRMVLDGTEPAPAPKIDLKPEWLALVRGGMEDVVNASNGTARGSRARKKRFVFAGKTGTAQVRRISKEERKGGVIDNADLAWALRDHALFVAFAPIVNPRLAVSVIVEHGGSGSRAAAPIARDIIQRALSRGLAA